jgi:predicted nucleic acid-binding protein
LIDVYVFDACSLIALLTNEDGADVVKHLLQRSVEGKNRIVMHIVNLLEVYYDTYKTYNAAEAEKLLEYVKVSPINITNEITDKVVRQAGYLKAKYKISLADSIGLAEAIIHDGYFVTADHNEMETVQQKENLKIIWIRERLKKENRANPRP